MDAVSNNILWTLQAMQQFGTAAGQPLVVVTVGAGNGSVTAGVSVGSVVGSVGSAVGGLIGGN